MPCVNTTDPETRYTFPFPQDPTRDIPDLGFVNKKLDEKLGPGGMPILLREHVEAEPGKASFAQHLDYVSRKGFGYLPVPRNRLRLSPDDQFATLAHMRYVAAVYVFVNI